MNKYTTTLIVTAAAIISSGSSCKKSEETRKKEEEQKQQQESNKVFSSKVVAIETLASDPHEKFPYRIQTREQVRIEYNNNATGTLYIHVHDENKTYAHVYVDANPTAADAVNWPSQFYVCDVKTLNRSYKDNSQFAGCQSFEVNDEVKKSFEAIVETLYLNVETKLKTEEKNKKVSEQKVNEILRRRYETAVEKSPAEFIEEKVDKLDAQKVPAEQPLPEEPITPKKEEKK